jgi:hypothetical protein
LILKSFNLESKYYFLDSMVGETMRFWKRKKQNEDRAENNEGKNIDIKNTEYSESNKSGGTDYHKNSPSYKLRIDLLKLLENDKKEDFEKKGVKLTDKQAPVWVVKDLFKNEFGQSEVIDPIVEGYC